MTNIITIKSQKGTPVTLTMGKDGVVVASVNGAEYRGTSAKYGVQMFGSNKGDYLQVTDGGVAIIAAEDIRAARAFFEAAREAVARNCAEVARRDHEANMADPYYAAEHNAYRVSASMDRANSND